MKDTYEVEIKSLLGSKENADALKTKLCERDSSCTLVSSYTQLNHYFEGDALATLAITLAPHLTPETKEKLARIVEGGSKVSVRTREMNGEVRFVAKASLGSDTSENGVIRLEIEEQVQGLTLEELDALILSAGYTYQAKWSRSREEYKTGPISVCVDKNAGYGYLAEFERVVEEQEAITQAKLEVLALMQEVGVEELEQDRLERMFEHYNQHWSEYYGTDNIFVIE